MYGHLTPKHKNIRNINPMIKRGQFPQLLSFLCYNISKGEKIMVITPSSDVILLKCPLELSQDNQLSFTSKTTQYNYFNGLPKYTAGTNFTYVRKDGVLRIPENFDDLIEYNYVMYRNDAYSNKWFYAFIDKMEYVNDGMTAVSIKTDVFQTWQFDLEYKRTFVEREHANNDTIGLHTLDEGLELGEYIINATEDVDITLSSTYGDDKAPFVAIGVTIPPTNFNGIENIVGSLDGGAKINGLPTGLTYYLIDTSGSNVRTFIKLYDENSKTDAIVNVFTVPALYIAKMLTSQDDDTSAFTFDVHSGGHVSGLVVGRSNSAIEMADKTKTAPSTINGYTPKNKKLLTYPYCFQKVSNNGGTDVIYRWEDFTNRTPKYKIMGSLTQGMSIKLYPYNYLNSSNANAYNYGITGQKFPTCSWTSDFYLNWVNQQGQNLALQTAVSIGNTMLGGIVASGVAGGVAGVAGGLLGTGLNLVGTIGNAVQKQHEAELVPPQAKGNVNSGDVNFSFGKSGFTISDMSIKSEYAQIIDDWFSMFGYKTNRVKIPNISGRSNWNYVKTIGCYILADIPQDDLQEIKQMFDNGLTIWHHANTFMDYSQSNAII